MSHPIPLHPADSLEHVLDDMRQCVASRRDEGWLTRALMLLIRYELLCIIEILLGLLADFRAGKFPPVPQAAEIRRVGDSPTIAAQFETGRDGTAPPPVPARAIASPRRAAPSREIPAPGAIPANDPAGDPADAPEPARRGPAYAPPRPAGRRPEQGPRGIPWYPSHVPRPAAGAFGAMRAKETHAYFIPIS